MHMCHVFTAERGQFRDIFRGATEYITDYQFACRFEVSKIFLRGWASGAGRPHPLLQKQIVNFILETLANDQ